MSAFTKNNPSGISASNPVQHQRWYSTVQHNSLPEFKLKFLNPEACQEISPYNKRFWPALIESLSDKSQEVMDLPKSINYRGNLEQYRHLRVHITAETWRQAEEPGRGLGAPLHLVLSNVRVTHAHDRTGTMVTLPDAAVDHMHIWVSVSWMNQAQPIPGEPLVLEGVLYEYASSLHTRNIGVLPVLLAGKNRKVELDRVPFAQPACPEPVL